MNESAGLEAPFSTRHGEHMSDLVTRDEFRSGVGTLRDEIRHLSGRMDRMQLTLVAGFHSMIVALLFSGAF